MVDDRLAMPRNRRSAPEPASPTRPTVPPGRTNSPIRNIEIPTTVMMTPATSRRVCIATKPSSGRIAATGGIFAARRAGTMTDSIVMPDAHEGGHEDGPWQQDGFGVRESGAGCVEEQDETSGNEQAADETEHRAHDPERERLHRDHPADLAARGSDSAKQGQLAEALTDADLEDVVDDERAHERSDECEHE